MGTEAPFATDSAPTHQVMEGLLIGIPLLDYLHLPTGSGRPTPSSVLRTSAGAGFWTLRRPPPAYDSARSLATSKCIPSRRFV
jgi:hypothetical protein